ncbi:MULTISPECIES: PepSY domain-containing protein [unclassified Caballeronia]|uniref:PepSY domain-containing protein n=1 Tax=unclassified Caballeronia TaxID=2646786 RepID=UPI002027A149|nr:MULTISPECIES: PepSY domain-containing protein [unclassified Caballeronia]
MLKILALSLALCFSGAAFAKADCTAHPKSEWMKESDAKAQLEAQGYKIRKFKVDGNCYEIYGHDKNGKKVEIYYDTKTLAVVKSEVE